MNQAVKRNLDRFPKDFMFQITSKEWKQISSSQFVMMENLPKNRTGKYLLFAFTEHGVTMLANVLKSKKAIKMSPDSYRDYRSCIYFFKTNGAATQGPCREIRRTS